MSNPTYNPQDLLSKEDPVDIFELTEQLAVGAFGAVYSGIYLPTKEIVAVKICALEDEDSLPELLAEISILKNINHPNSIKFFGAYQKDQELFIAMELAAGGAVNTLFEANGCLTEPVISYIIQETLKGLDFLHESCHIIHRDIKAPNVLLTSEGQVKLADFGVSAVLSSPTQKRRTFVGTPWWMAPEIIRAAQDLDVTYGYGVDIWATGIMCIELAEAMPPLCNLQPMDVLDEIVNREPPTLTQPDKWGSDFRLFIAQCLVRDQENRPSAKSLLSTKFIKNCKGKSSDIVVLLQNKDKLIQSQTAEQNTLDSSTKNSTNQDADEEEEEEEDSDDAEEEPVGFQPKTMSAKLATTKTIDIQKTSKAGVSVGQTLRDQVNAEKEMHLQLRAMKKQQKETQKLIEKEEQKNLSELQKIEKKKVDKMAAIEKEEKKLFKKLEKDHENLMQDLTTRTANEIKIESKTLAVGLKETKKSLEQEVKEANKTHKEQIKAQLKEKKSKGASKDEIKHWEAETELTFRQTNERSVSERELERIKENGRILSSKKKIHQEEAVDFLIKHLGELLKKKEEFEGQKKNTEVDFLKQKHEQEMKHCDALDEVVKNAWQAQQRIRIQELDKTSEINDKAFLKRQKLQTKAIEKELKLQEKKVVKEKKMDKSTASALFKEKKQLKVQQYEVTSQTDFNLEKKLNYVHLFSREEDLCRVEEQQLRSRLKVKSKQLNELFTAEQTDSVYDELIKYLGTLEARFEESKYVEQIQGMHKIELEAIDAAFKTQSAMYEEHYHQITKLYSSIKKTAPSKESVLEEMKSKQENIIKQVKDSQEREIKEFLESFNKKKKEFMKNHDKLQKEKESSSKRLKEKNNEKIYHFNEDQFKELKEVIKLRKNFEQKLEEKHTEFRLLLENLMKKELSLLTHLFRDLQHLAQRQDLQDQLVKEHNDRRFAVSKKYLSILEKDMQRLETLYESKKDNLDKEHKRAQEASEYRKHKGDKSKDKKKSQTSGDHHHSSHHSSSSSERRERRKSQSQPENEDVKKSKK